jgi:hypothetical protein
MNKQRRRFHKTPYQIIVVAVYLVVDLLPLLPTEVNLHLCHEHFELLATMQQQLL